MRLRWPSQKMFPVFSFFSSSSALVESLPSWSVARLVDPVAGFLCCNTFVSSRHSFGITQEPRAAKNRHPPPEEEKKKGGHCVCVYVVCVCVCACECVWIFQGEEEEEGSLGDISGLFFFSVESKRQFKLFPPQPLLISTGLFLTFVSIRS